MFLHYIIIHYLMCFFGITFAVYMKIIRNRKEDRGDGFSILIADKCNILQEMEFNDSGDNHYLKVAPTRDIVIRVFAIYIRPGQSNQLIETNRRIGEKIKKFIE